MHPLARPASRALLVLAIAVGASMVQLLPAMEAAASPLALISGTGPELAGGGIDQLGTLYTLDHVARMLRGEVGTVAPMFAPMGLDMANAQGMAWLDVALSAPLVWLRGAVGAYDLHLLATLVLSFLGIFWMLRRGVDAPVSWALALATAVIWSPFVTQELYGGRPTQAHLLFHALFLSAVLSLPRTRGAVLGGLLLVAACLVYWFSGAAVGLMAGIALLAQVGPGWLRRIGAGLLLGIVAVGLVLLLMGPAAREQLAAVGALQHRWSMGWGPLTVHSPILPQRFPSWSTLLQHPDLRGIQRLWWGLALAGLVLKPRKSLPWLLGLGIVGTMLFGSVIYIGDQAWFTASAFLQQVWPPILRAFAPMRMIVAPLLGLSLVGGIVGREAARRWPRGSWAGAALVVLLAFQARPHVPPKEAVSRPLAAADFYLDATGKVPGGIIDLPLINSETEFVYQVLHRQPLLGGMGIGGPNTRPSGHETHVQRNTWIRWVEGVAGISGPAPDPDPADLALLWEDGFRLLIFHGRRVVERRVLDDTLGRPVVLSPHRAAYRLPPPP